MSVDIELCKPTDIDRETWEQEMQSIAVRAYDKALRYINRDQVSYFTEVGTPDRYYDSHLDPNVEVGKRFDANQSFSRPRVALAYVNRRDDRKLVGWGYSVNTVVGGGPPEGPHNTSFRAELARTARRLSVVQNKLLLREIVVLYGYREEGIATQIARTLLRDANAIQSVVIDTLPEHDRSFVTQKLKKLGFVDKLPEQQAPLFGPECVCQPARLLRMEAPTVRSVLVKL